MVATPYRSVNLAEHQTITTDILDQLGFNLQHLWEVTPRGRFVQDNNAIVSTGLVLVGGRVKISKNKKQPEQKAVVNFKTPFAADCRPHVTTGIVSSPKRQIFCTVTGLGSLDTPDHRGFEVNVVVEDATRKVTGSGQRRKKISVIDREFYVSWHALGWREE